MTISIVLFCGITVIPLALKGGAHRQQEDVWASTQHHGPCALILLTEFWCKPYVHCIASALQGAHAITYTLERGFIYRGRKTQHTLGVL